MKQSNKSYLVIALLGSLLFSACQSPTPYKSAEKPGEKFGYTETKLDGDFYRVTFKGNEETDRSTVETYMLYRVAQLAKKQGFDYFTFVSRDSKRIEDVDVNYTSTALGAPYIGASPGFGVTAFPYYTSYGWGSRPVVDVDDRYTAVGYVEFKKTHKADEKFFSAEEVMRELKPRIKTS